MAPDWLVQARRPVLLQMIKLHRNLVLDRAGIVTPPGIVIGSKQWRLPPWLRFPLVLKPAFEHMSRGVAVAETVRGLLKVGTHAEAISTTHYC